MAPIMRALFGWSRRSASSLSRLGVTIAQALSGDQPMPQLIQATVKTTNASGRVQWTFSTPFGAGVTPVVSADVLAATGQPYSLKLVSVDNTQVTLDVLTSLAVSVPLISLTVLTALSLVGAGVSVNLVAMEPSA